MSASSPNPKSKDFPKAGDLCQGCHKFWKQQGENPKYLVHVFDAEGNPVTTEGGVEIVICPHCDGSAILQLDK